MALAVQQRPAVAVERGGLPPLEQRLPPQPVIVKPGHELGRCGGAWRFAQGLGVEAVLSMPPNILHPEARFFFCIMNALGARQTFNLYQLYK